MLALLAVPAAAMAQRDLFFSALVEFHKSSAGLYGDEGPPLTARLDAMSKALDAWDRDIRDAETELRVHLAAGAVETRPQVHTLLAARYLERGRFADAVLKTSGGARRTAFFSCPKDEHAAPEHRLDQRIPLLDGTDLRGSIFDELDADHHALAANVADKRMLLLQVT